MKNTIFTYIILTIRHWRVLLIKWIPYIVIIGQSYQGAIMIHLSITSLLCFVFQYPWWISDNRVNCTSDIADWPVNSDSDRITKLNPFIIIFISDFSLNSFSSWYWGLDYCCVSTSQWSDITLLHNILFITGYSTHAFKWCKMSLQNHNGFNSPPMHRP